MCARLRVWTRSHCGGQPPPAPAHMHATHVPPTCEGRVRPQHREVNHAGVVGHPDVAGARHRAGAVVPDHAWRGGGGAGGGGAGAGKVRGLGAGCWRRGRRGLRAAQPRQSSRPVHPCPAASPVHDTTNMRHRNWTSQRSACWRRWPCGAGGRAGEQAAGHGRAGPCAGAGVCGGCQQARTHALTLASTPPTQQPTMAPSSLTLSHHPCHR